MLKPTKEMLVEACKNRYAIGAFNIYNLEGATAVIRSAEELKSPVILQLLPTAVMLGGSPLVKLCLELGRKASVDVAVHLDHCSSMEIHKFAIESGVSSVMADGAGMEFDDNVKFTSSIVQMARQNGAAVEGELGKLSGEEDGLKVDEREAKMTSPAEAALFIEKTGVDALAVCIGNVHGRYKNPPRLDFARLLGIAKVTDIPLVLHGTSGLPDEMIKEAIGLGVCKFNVNTEVRNEYLRTMKEAFEQEEKVELVDIMERSITAMMEPVKQKIRLFNSAGY